MIYEWKEGTRTKLDPNAVGQRFREIEERDGRLTPAAVVKDAARKRSPLRGFFDWDNDSAAHKHRLAQAAFLIRKIEVRVTVGDEECDPIRAFVNIQRGDHYRGIVDVMLSPEERKLLLQTAWEELKQWQGRYKELKEFAAIFEAIDGAPEIAA